MSVFYVLYLSDDNKNNYEDIKRTIIDLMPPTSDEIAKSKPQISENNDKQLSTWCDNFWLRLKNDGQQVQFKSEDYNISFKYQFWFDVYTAYPNWFEGLISFVGKVMSKLDGDCVFESNGETSIIMRLNSEITIDKRYLTQEQVNSLIKMGLSYIEGELPKV